MSKTHAQSTKHGKTCQNIIFCIAKTKQVTSPLITYVSLLHGDPKLR